MLRAITTAMLAAVLASSAVSANTVEETFVVGVAGDWEFVSARDYCHVLLNFATSPDDWGVQLNSQEVDRCVLWLEQEADIATDNDPAAGWLPDTLRAESE